MSRSRVAGPEHRRRSAASRVRPAGAAALTLALLLLALPGSARAQTVSGALRDELTRAPIELAQVWLSRDGQPHGRVVTTDALGRFALPAVPGRYIVRARRIGYVELASDPVELAAGVIATLELRMLPRPAAFADTVTTTAAPLHPDMVGFEERRRLGLGVFFDRDAIVARGEPRLIDLLRLVPGVIVPSGQVGSRTQTAMARSTWFGRCAAVVFVDGIKMNSPDAKPEEVRMALESVSGPNLEAVEVYRGRSELPAAFGGPDVRCGAIIAWTRRGPRRTRDLPAVPATPADSSAPSRS
jgi:hypothetical protein